MKRALNGVADVIQKKGGEFRLLEAVIFVFLGFYFTQPKVIGEKDNFIDFM